MISELSVATSAAAPTREHLTIGIALNDSSTPLIDDINRIVGADSDPPRAIKSKCPLGNECAVRSEFLHTVTASICYVNVASLVDGDPIRLRYLSAAIPPGSYGA